MIYHGHMRVLRPPPGMTSAEFVAAFNKQGTASELAAAGWRLERLAVVDLFPDTSHVETVGVFTAR